MGAAQARDAAASPSLAVNISPASASGPSCALALSLAARALVAAGGRDEHTSGLAHALLACELDASSHEDDADRAALAARAADHAARLLQRPER